MKLVECVPNFSEGRRSEIVIAIREAIAGVDDTVVLDVSSDPSHNRSVITFVAQADRAAAAAYAGIVAARDLIDLRQHSGEHPRMGATDVVPFVPLEGTTMEDCIALARELGERVGRELAIPVYLYERAATRPERENLANVRRGEFEGIRDEIATNPARAPDFGPARVHPSAGAVAIGARPFLVAYNVYLGSATNLAVAKAVAKAIRGSSGGLRHVKALGLEVDGQAQVSINLVNVEQTPVHRVFDMVKMEAAARGVTPTWSEIVGLVPERSLIDAAVRHLQLDSFTGEQVLERRIREAARGAQSLAGFVSAVASSTPTPGGGSVVAHVGALAAALAQMVAGLTIGRQKYAAVDGEFREIAQRARALGFELSRLAERDAQAYAAVSGAYAMPKEPLDTATGRDAAPARAPTADAGTARDAAIANALLGASVVPLETARACAQVASLAEAAAARGNANAVSDAGVAALLADAACRGAAYNVRINVAALPSSRGTRSRGDELVREAQALVHETNDRTARVIARVEEML